MTAKNIGDALLHLRTLFNEGAIGALSDGQLLERFTTGRGEPRELAFAALVERHGPIVLHVCRSILRDESAAEDAFQATFLALARKAGSLWAQDSLAPWLHQAAYRAAAHDLSATIRRRSHEHRAAALRPESVAPPPHANDDDLEITEHHRNPEATPQAVDFLMDDLLEVVIVARVRRRHRFGAERGRRMLARAAPDCGRSVVNRSSIGSLVQPGGQ